MHQLICDGFEEWSRRQVVYSASGFPRGGVGFKGVGSRLAGRVVTASFWRSGARQGEVAKLALAPALRGDLCQ